MQVFSYATAFFVFIMATNAMPTAEPAPGSKTSALGNELRTLISRGKSIRLWKTFHGGIL